MSLQEHLLDAVDKIVKCKDLPDNEFKYAVHSEIKQFAASVIINIGNGVNSLTNELRWPEKTK